MVGNNYYYNATTALVPLQLLIPFYPSVILYLIFVDAIMEATKLPEVSEYFTHAVCFYLANVSHISFTTF